MSKLKKQPKNAFAFFMEERRVELRKRGHVFPGGLKEVAVHVEGEWKNLPPAERQRFEQLAKEYKEKDSSNLGNKFTSTGESYAALEERKIAQETERIQLQTLFRKVVHQPKPEEVIYIVMKAISSCEVGLPDGQGGKEVFPLELAMGAFNIKDGFICNYWTLIDTVTIPCGWSSSALQTSKETLLPQPGSSLFETECRKLKVNPRNYKAILTNIRKFIETWLDEYPSKKFMIFAMNYDISTIKGSLDWLVKNYDGDDKESHKVFFDALKFYPLPDFVIELSGLANKLNPSFVTEIVQFKLPGSAERVLNYALYEYKDEITCPYHVKKEYADKMHLCCKNVVLRRIFSILEEVAEQGFNCPLTDRHRITSFFNAKLPDHLAKKIPKVAPTQPPSSSSSSSGSDPSQLNNTSNLNVKSRDGNLSAPRKNVIAHDDDDDTRAHSYREKSPEYIPKWGSSSSRLKNEETTSMDDEDFPPLSTSTAPTGRGRGFHQVESKFKPKPELEEDEPINYEDDNVNLHRPLNAGSYTSNGSSGRGRGIAYSAYPRW